MTRTASCEDHQLIDSYDMPRQLTDEVDEPCQLIDDEDHQSIDDDGHHQLVDNDSQCQLIDNDGPRPWTPSSHRPPHPRLVEGCMVSFPPFVS